MDHGQEPAPEVDFAEMERQIQALLGGDAQAETRPPEQIPEQIHEQIHEQTAEQPAAEPAPAVDVRADALEAEPIDPLIREIDAALSDDADALLRNSNGDIGGAVRSVFDERALSGQEEEINRALIEAFGTSRVERPSFGQPAVTNPLPGFEGAARPLPPDIPREERDREAAAAPVAETTVAEPTGPRTDETAPRTVHETAPAVTPAAERPAAAAEPSRREPTHPPSAAPMPLAEPKPDERRPRGSPMQILLLPVRALAFPMRALPAQAHAIVTIAAITLLLWAPVAWWLAQRAVKTPLVGPVRIHAAPVVASGDGAAADAGTSGH